MKVLIFICLAIIHGSYCVDDYVSVSCNYGYVKGKVVHGNEKPYEAFYSIPYAKPPVGPLRFSNPVPCDSWKNAYDATYPRSECLQKIYYGNTPYVKGDEDCLYLSVYRPCNRKPHEKLPVIVYFGFGAFTNSYTSPENLSPDYFMDTERVIVVVVQSRLGPFGYLSSGDTHCLGNFGLKDQRLALQWVSDNIEAFQGDCDCVTLMGAGSGAISAVYHWLNDDTSQLFQKVILKSCKFLYHAAIYDDPYEQFLDHAKLIGVQYPEKLSTLELTEKLRKADAKLLLSAADMVPYWKKDDYYRLVVEPNCNEAYVTKDPLKAWELGHFEPKPLYVTFTQNDGNVRAGVLLDKRLRKQFNLNVEKNLADALNVDPKYLPDVKHYYFKDGKCKVTDYNIWTYLDIFTTRYFEQSLYNTVKCYVRNFNTQKYPLSIDKFNFNGPNHFTKVFTGYDVNLGTGFSDDLLYLFRFPSLFMDFHYKSVDYQVKNIYVDTHINFAVTGMPTQWSHLAPCDNHNFQKNGFCEYQEFGNQTQYVNRVLHNQATVEPSCHLEFDQVYLWNQLTSHY
ncbi:juvenile hormone esterase-like isoform X3 [Phlebotomus papatasi]|uniref:juvenile hormone esterase-like isoform X3 n=1 Tax=Phlebotomus papatasi TaxID=29031 RepID=UPI0024846E80|nr:juvenile hormone esterase-like isoform X3 [Phlebotomus papatasi]